MALKRFKIVSETYINGKVARVGDIVEVSESDASLLKEANRVEEVGPEPAKEDKKK